MDAASSEKSVIELEAADRKISVRSEVTRLRILDAAAAVMGRKGFAGSPLSDIGKLAGMKAGSLYYHFASREELVAEVMTMGVNQTFHSVEKRLDGLPAGTSHLERLKIAMETHLLCLVDKGDYARAVTKLSGQVPKHIQERHAANEKAYAAVWRKLLGDARDAGEIRADLNLAAVRMLILGAMSWSIEWYRPENGPAELVARDFAEMILHGLAIPALDLAA